MPELYFHDLRRSAFPNMEPAGIPRKVAMSIAGHLTEAKAARKMEQFFEEAKAVEAPDARKKDRSVQ